MWCPSFRGSSIYLFIAGTVHDGILIMVDSSFQVEEFLIVERPYLGAWDAWSQLISCNYFLGLSFLTYNVYILWSSMLLWYIWFPVIILVAMGWSTSICAGVWEVLMVYSIAIVVYVWDSWWYLPNVYSHLHLYETNVPYRWKFCQWKQVTNLVKISPDKNFWLYTVRLYILVGMPLNWIMINLSIHENTLS